jgi:hypothetical protein
MEMSGCVPRTRQAAVAATKDLTGIMRAITRELEQVQVDVLTAMRKNNGAM